MSSEPAVKLLVPGLEAGGVVVGVEAVEPQPTGRAHASWIVGFLLKSSTSSGTAVAGLSSSATNRSNAPFERTKSGVA